MYYLFNKVSYFKVTWLQVSKMLYYDKITDSEGIDKSEGQDCVGVTNLI